jgi:hypothetical protein
MDACNETQTHNAKDGWGSLDAIATIYPSYSIAPSFRQGWGEKRG